MADNGIRVAVLENSFAALKDLGVPFSVCLQLQQSDLKLAEAHWTARSTSSGFSVSFFWPVESYRSAKQQPRRKKRSRKPKKVNNIRSEVRGTEEGSRKSVAEGSKVGKAVLLNDAHQDCSSPPPGVPSLGTTQREQEEDSLTDESTDRVQKPVDLRSCVVVEYEKHGDVHGVKFRNETEEGWTPVVKRRRRQSKPCVSDSSDDELFIPEHATVKYHLSKDGTPGLHLRTKRTRGWTPIMPSPVAFRTRTRTRNKS